MTFSAYAADFRNDNVVAGDAWWSFELIDASAERPSVDQAPVLAEDESSPDLIGAFWPHLPLLRRYLRRRVPAADLDDVLQDVLLSIVRRADTASVVHPKSYLFQAAQTALIDHYRRRTTRRAACHCQLDESDHPVDEISPLRILLARDDVRAVEEALRQLPERTQEILVAMRIEGSSLKALASRYSISTSAIEKHVTKATKALSALRRSAPFAASHPGVLPRRQKLFSDSL